jgi:Protein of unknown function (DUF3631)
MTDDAMFAPLNTEDIANAASAPDPTTSKVTPIIPVPDDAPPCQWRHPKHGAPVARWPYHDADGRLVGYAARVEYVEAGDRKKDVYPVTYCRVDGATGQYYAWRSRGVPTPRPLYRLADLIAAPASPIIVTEGEKKADVVPALFPGYFGTTSMGGARAAKGSDWAPLAGHKVIIWPDHDEPGRLYADDVATLAVAAGAVSVAIVTVPADWLVGWDLADPVPEGTATDVLAELLQLARPWTPPAPNRRNGEVDDGVEIARLAALAPLAYERERQAAAKRLDCRAPILDRLVAGARNNGATTTGQGRALDLYEPEPWPHPVDGATLLDQMAATVRRHVVLGETEAAAVALWVLATHAFDAFSIFPRLFVTAPEKGCGKTTLLDVLSCLVARPLAASSIKAAALFRTIETAQPTLLLDEADAYVRSDEDLRSVLDSGHSRRGSVIRCVGDDHEPRQFSTWAPVALAAIGHLPGTIEDRSIRIGMRRRRPDEKVESLRLDRAEHLERLACMAARWAADHAARLATADPAIPAGIVNRAADNWRPLLAVADLAGGGWPERGRGAAIGLSLNGEETVSAKVLLLADLRGLFDREPPNGVLFTREILAALHQDETRPWPEWKNGKPITDRQLAALLKEFKIVPRTVRRGADTEKGYRFEWFEDIFARYLPPRSVTGSQMRDSAGFETLRSVTLAPHATSDVTDRRQQKGRISATCDGVTVSETPSCDNSAMGNEEAVWTG